jgi:hypothetical protein
MHSFYPYNDKNQRVCNITAGGGICGCCGGKFGGGKTNAPKVKDLRNTLGITIYTGKYGKTIETPTEDKTVIKTDSGYLTILTRKVW